MTAVPLTPLEVASGLVLGTGAEVDLPSTGGDPVAAFEEALRPALRRPPCLVSFSGGRDSSTVLVVATALARREGLPLPVPVTHRLRDEPESDETAWQERVVRWLRLEDWQRLESGDELDVVGPVAASVLRRHGLLWPLNAHFHAPLLDAARGGSLLTGIGGDEAFSRSQWSRAAAVAGRRARPEPRDVLRLGLALAPPSLRRPVLRRRGPDGFGWLRPEARTEVLAELAGEAAREPFGWARRFRWLAGLRYLDVGARNLALLADDADALLVHPFADRDFLGALAGLPKADRFERRTEGLRAVFAGLVPDDVLGRRSKASFDGAFWNRHSRAFAAAWGGEDVDEALVDLEALRREWESEHPDPRTFTLLQSAWLARERRSGGRERVEQPLAGVGH